VHDTDRRSDPLIWTDASHVVRFHFHSGWLAFILVPPVRSLMSIDTVRVRPDTSSTPRPDRRVFDVSERPPAEIVEYARETDTDCYLERKGGRTYLVAD
jgi:hypothetical protein